MGNTQVASGAMHLDIPSLRTLVTVVDMGGMTAAAEQLSLSQSAVSWKIKRLEERIGRPLLVRDGRAVRLTVDGEELVEHARTLLAVHDEAVARIRSSELVGRVCIGANDEISASQLVDLMGRFDRIHPRALIEFHVDQSTALARSIERGELDVAVLQVEESKVTRHDEVLWTDPLCWATSSQHVGHDEPIGLITYGSDCCYAPIATKALRKAGITHRVAFAGQSSSSVEAAVEAGFGVAVLSERQLTESVVRWEPPVEMPLPSMAQIVRARQGAGSPIVAALVRELTAEVTPPPQP